MFDDLSSYSGNNGDIAILSVAWSSDPRSGYSVTGYVWRKDISAWVAMNGNYNANNVYFDYDLIKAGAWTSLGNVSHTKDTAETLETTNKSLAEVMEMIFTGQVEYPNDVTSAENKPSCSISQTTGNYEVGT